MSAIDLFFATGERRTLAPWLAAAAKAYAAAIAVGVVYTTVATVTDIFAVVIIFLAAMLALVFLTIEPTARSSGRTLPHPVDALLSLAAIATGLYFWFNLDAITTRIALFDELSTWDVLFGSISLALVIEGTRRTTGLGLTLIVLGFIAYNLLGHLLSGPLAHGYVGYDHFLDLTFFTTDGVYGVPLRVAATYAFLFVLFGSLLARAGGGDFFHNLGAILAGRTTGGSAKIAVVSSGMFGMVSGSPTSDVVTTGSITMPMMVRAGYTRVQSGAIEVAASTGGSIMPPVMGSVAFIMAEYTGIPYTEIALAAIVPALLYYLGVMVQVHFMSRRMGMAGLPADEIPTLRQTLPGAELFLVPLAVIVIALAADRSALIAAFYGAVAVIAVAASRWLLLALVRRGPLNLGAAVRRGIMAVYESLAETTMRTVAITAACAAAGMVIGGMGMTGLAAKFSAMIVSVTGGELFLSLMVAGAVTILLGMGMPTPSAYILATVLVGPALKTLGMDAMTANMFLLYYAVMSATTPPVAVAAFAAAAIAQANPISIAAQATRLSIAAFVVPFTFAYSPVLLLQGEVGEIAFAVATAALGIAAIGIAAEGYFRRALGPLQRLLLLAGGLLLVAPVYWTAALAVLLLALALGPQLLQRPPRLAKSG